MLPVLSSLNVIIEAILDKLIVIGTSDLRSELSKNILGECLDLSLSLNDDKLLALILILMSYQAHQLGEEERSNISIRMAVSSLHKLRLLAQPADQSPNRLAPRSTGKTIFSDWESFSDHFELRWPTFGNLLHKASPTLSRSEKRICMLISCEFKNAYIGKMLSISPKTVENHRGRIRQKLRLSRKENLQSALIGLRKS